MVVKKGKKKGGGKGGEQVAWGSAPTGGGGRERAREALPKPVSLASIQAEEARELDPQRYQRRNRNEAWYNKQGMTVMSMEEIQRREIFEAEEEEARALIAAVYGDANV